MTLTDEAFKALCQSISKGDGWLVGTHTIMHPATHIQIWVANGWSGLRNGPSSSYPMDYTFRQRRVLWRCAQDLVSRRLVEALK